MSLMLSLVLSWVLSWMLSCFCHKRCYGCCHRHCYGCCHEKMKRSFPMLFWIFLKYPNQHNVCSLLFLDYTDLYNLVFYCFWYAVQRVDEFPNTQSALEKWPTNMSYCDKRIEPVDVTNNVIAYLNFLPNFWSHIF